VFFSILDMPQLDSATFVGQVTWFSLVFSAFYLIVLTDVLPSLNRAVKVRAKRLDRVRGDARQFDGVSVSAQDSVDSMLSSGSKGVSSLVSSALGGFVSRVRLVTRKRMARS